MLMLYDDSDPVKYMTAVTQMDELTATVFATFPVNFEGDTGEGGKLTAFSATQKKAERGCERQVMGP